MKYLLDTNLCIYIIRHPRSRTAARFETIPDEDVVISTVVAGELLAGPMRKKRPPVDAMAVDEFLQTAAALPFDMDCARVFAAISAAIIDAGTPVGGLDLAIAATAIHHGLTVITHNQRDFGKIPGLQYEDWQQEEDPAP